MFIVGFCALFLLVPKTTTAATLAADDLWEKGFNNHGSIMLLIDTESGKILKANQAAATFYGYSVDQLQKMNIAQIHMYSPEEVERERLAAASEERNHFIFPHRLASGEVRTVEVHSYPIDEEQSLLFSVINDITARQVAENELLDRNSRLRRAEVLTGLGSWELRLSDNQLFLSDGAERILGLVSGASLEDLDAVTVPEYREVRQQALQALIEENIPYDIELKFERPGDGAIIDVHSVGEYDPETNSVFGSLLDITEQRAAEKSLEVSRKREIYSFWTFFLFQLIAIFVLVTNILQRRKAQQELQQNLQRNESLVHILQHQLDEIKYLSYHDQLTGLYNRRFFEKKLQELDVAENLPLSLIIADLNNLKLVNDTFGHVVGDQFLQRTAEVIKKTCHAKDIVARWGGDEFVLLLPKTTSHGAQAIMQRIEKSIREETVGSMSISIALGWSTKTKSGEALSAVFKNAENHMYRSKLVQGSGIRAETGRAIPKASRAKIYPCSPGLLQWLMLMTPWLASGRIERV